jgi:hypothetical protein
VTFFRVVLNSSIPPILAPMMVKAVIRKPLSLAIVAICFRSLLHGGIDPAGKDSSIMRAALITLLTFASIASLGCHHNVCRNGCGHARHSCNACGGSGHLHGGGPPTPVAHLPHGYMEAQLDGSGAPPSATYAYPYYTLRGPRDFLLNNPPNIGP